MPPTAGPSAGVVGAHPSGWPPGRPLLTDSEAELRTGRPVIEAVPPAKPAAMGITAASGLCDYVETSAGVVAKVFPRPGELALLCHVREVSLADTELARSDENRQLAVVLSARLPRAPAGAPARNQGRRSDPGRPGHDPAQPRPGGTKPRRSTASPAQPRRGPGRST